MRRTVRVSRASSLLASSPFSRRRRFRVDSETATPSPLSGSYMSPARRDRRRDELGESARWIALALVACLGQRCRAQCLPRPAPQSPRLIRGDRPDVPGVPDERSEAVEEAGDDVGRAPVLTAGRRLGPELTNLV